MIITIYTHSWRYPINWRGGINKMMETGYLLDNKEGIFYGVF
jgi:hypothetical protein